MSLLTLFKKNKNVPNRGGVQKCLKFKFGHLKPHGEGGLNFSKMSELYVTHRPHPNKEKLKHLIRPFSM